MNCFLEQLFQSLINFLENVKKCVVWLSCVNHNNDEVSVNELDSFTDSLAHRGPDGKSTLISKEKNLGLGHRRLSILDILKAGSQPMSYKNNRYQIFYNGEVYNFQEFKKELLKLDYKFESNTDTEIILTSK